MVDEPDPAARPRRRSFTAEYKARILDEYDALPVGSSERGGVAAPRGPVQLASGGVAQGPRRRCPRRPGPEGEAASFPEQVELERLRRRNERLETELAKTRSALEIMGKLHALLERLSESADTDPKSTP